MRRACLWHGLMRATFRSLFSFCPAFKLPTTEFQSSGMTSPLPAEPSHRPEISIRLKKKQKNKNSSIKPHCLLANRIFLYSDLHMGHFKRDLDYYLSHFLSAKKNGFLMSSPGRHWNVPFFFPTAIIGPSLLAHRKWGSLCGLFYLKTYIHFIRFAFVCVRTGQRATCGK